MKTSFLPALVFVCALAFGPSAGAKEVRLDSGKTVELLSVGPMIGKSWSALELKYRTRLKIDDVAALRIEADEIWQHFIGDVEHAGYDSAIITAAEPAEGAIVEHYRSYNFIFQKKDGVWHTLESKDRQKLDPEFVRSFLARMDSADRNGELNAMQLYLAKDWQIEVRSAGPRQAPPQILNRRKFAEVESRTRRALQSFHSRREILDIAISDDGLHAHVESRVTQDAAAGDRHFATVERDTDEIELANANALVTRSISLLEKRDETTSD